MSTKKSSKKKHVSSGPHSGHKKSMSHDVSKSSSIPTAPVHHVAPGAKVSDPSEPLYKHPGMVLFFASIAIITLVVIILVLLYNARSSPVVAIVGTEQITLEELNESYSVDAYRGTRTMLGYLTEVMVPERLLIFAASDISDSEVEQLYRQYLSESDMTDEAAAEILAKQGITLQRFKNIIKIQAFINKTIAPTVQVTTEEVSAFYEENKELLVEEGQAIPPLVDVASEIELFLYQQKIADSTRVYIDNLRQNTRIAVYLQTDGTIVSSQSSVRGTTTSSGSIATFKATGDAICLENGKPIIRAYSTTWCPHCKWIKSTYDDLVKQYVAEGKIVAYHWEVDTKDDTLTTAVETKIPISEMDIYQRYNPQGSIPTYVFGCAYSRIGNGYESQDDLEAEKAEFIAVIEDLIAKSAP